MSSVMQIRRRSGDDVQDLHFARPDGIDCTLEVHVGLHARTRDVGHRRDFLPRGEEEEEIESKLPAAGNDYSFSLLARARGFGDKDVRTMKSSGLLLDVSLDLGLVNPVAMQATGRLSRA